MVIEQLKNLPIQRIENISVDLTGFTKTAIGLVEQAERAVIETAENYASGGDLIKIASVQNKKVDALRAELGGPFHKMWKFINEQFGVTTKEFDAVRTTIEPKMLAWKREEDKRLAEEAAKEAKRIEDEALAKAALEKTEEAQDEVMEAAAEATEQAVENAGVKQTYGNYGSSTGTSKVYSTSVISQLDFVRALVKHIDDGNARNIELGNIIDFRKGGLNTLAKDMRKQGVTKMPGATFNEAESLRVR